MAQTNELAARNAIARELKPSLVSKLYHYSAAQLFEAEGRVRMLMYECALHKRTLCRANTNPVGFAVVCVRANDSDQLQEAPKAELQYFTTYLQPLLLIKAHLDMAAAHRFFAMDMDEKEYVVGEHGRRVGLGAGGRAGKAGGWAGERSQRAGKAVGWAGEPSQRLASQKSCRAPS